MKKFYVGIKGIAHNADSGVIMLRHKEFWDIPGGRIDGDETFEETLRREFSEELPGTEIISVSQLKGAYRVPKDIEPDTGLLLQYYVVEAQFPDPVVISDEHDEVLFIKSAKDIPEGVNPVVRGIISEILAS